MEADTFDNFLTLLLSSGKLADDSNISVFTKDGVKVYKVLITCKGDSILIRKQDERGHSRIPLVQHYGQWQPQRPTKQTKKFLQQANSVYDLPLTEKAVKWMHTCAATPSSQLGSKQSRPATTRGGQC